LWVKLLPRSAIHISKTCFQSRSMIRDLVRRELQIRFVGSLLGTWWNIIHPAVMIVVYSTVFSGIMHSRIPGGSGIQDSPFAYTIFLCSGLLPWNGMVETILKGTAAVFDNSHLVKKLSFPIEILVPSVLGTALFNFLVSMLVFMLLVVWSGTLSWHAVIVLPALVSFQFLFGLGLALFLSALAVFFRDVQQIVNISTTILFWMTPIVYVPEILPMWVQQYLQFNPMTHFIGLYREIILMGSIGSTEAWAIVAALSTISFCLGASFFCRFKQDIPDEI